VSSAKSLTFDVIPSGISLKRIHPLPIY
jgi:hypothetical protein